MYSIAKSTTAAVKKISREAWEGTRARHKKTLWSYQEYPENKTNQAWRRYLVDTFLKTEYSRVSKTTQNLGEQVDKINLINKLQKELDKLNSRYKKEKQRNRQFEINRRIKQKQKELNDLKKN